MLGVEPPSPQETQAPIWANGSHGYILAVSRKLHFCVCDVLMFGLFLIWDPRRDMSFKALRSFWIFMRE